MTSRMHLATRTFSLTLTAMLSLGMAHGASAAEAAPADVAAKPPIEQVEELDEIVVRGTALRDLIADAEDEFFQAFNKANKDDDFDTSCVYVTLSSTSNIKSRMCIPGFFADALADQAYFAQSCQSDITVDAQGNETEFAAIGCYTPPPPQTVLTERAKEYANHMMRVIRSSESLGDMAGRLDELYRELLGVQRQYIKVKTSGDAEKAPAKAVEGPRVH